MELTPEQLQSFIDLYQKKFGIVLTTSEAQTKASSVIQYVLLCLPPLAKKDENAIKDMPDTKP